MLFIGRWGLIRQFLHLIGVSCSEGWLVLQLRNDRLHVVCIREYYLGAIKLTAASISISGSLSVMRSGRSHGVIKPSVTNPRRAVHSLKPPSLLDMTTSTSLVFFNVVGTDL